MAVAAEEPLLFDDLEVGREWVSPERVVTAADVLAFADLTGDRQPIHLDPEFARATPFRRCIAHGLLGLSLGSGLGYQAPPLRVVAFAGLREWHFRSPVFVGDAIRLRQRVVAKERRPHGRRGVVTWQVAILNQDGRVVQEGVTVLIVSARGGGSEPRKAA
jgi:3-hydroxybutyryl-CoA dehydratase